MGMTGISDADVVGAVLDGDTEAFALLVRRYQDVLYAHAYRMVGGGDEAADLVQRAFVAGYQRLAECREPSRVGGWLFRILSNLCRDHQRSRRRSDVSLEVLPPLPASDEGPDGDAGRIEMGTRLRTALDRLEAGHREAFLMKHLEGRRYGEMSELLGVSVPALKMRVHRARDELRELLEEYR
jgi:RNA polymerase sigma-70 factor (ECF subfamily)